MKNNIENYVEIFKNKNFESLIKDRDNIIDKINEYDKLSNDTGQINIVEEDNYRQNHLYLSIICEVLYIKLGKNLDNIKSIDYSWIYLLKDYLKTNNLLLQSGNINMELRKKGIEFSISDHLKALVYSLLSNQRPWKVINENMDKINSIFLNFDIEKLKSEDPDNLIKEICKIKCGNRDINEQMKTLHLNINMMEKIEYDYGSIDNFINSITPYQVVNLISDNKSKYKFKRVGEALAWEYLKNIGVDAMKPDVHLCRFFSAERMGNGNKIPATMDETYQLVLKISESTGMSMYEIDSIIWSFCSSGYGEICTSNPKCHLCPIKKYCNK